MLNKFYKIFSICNSEFTWNIPKMITFENVITQITKAKYEEKNSLGFFFYLLKV